MKCAGDAQMSKPKKLKLWNGRWFPKRHIYIAAHSVDDVLAMLKEWQGFEQRGARSEILKYWSAGHWGTPMNGIAPERGIWLQEQSEKPIKQFPRDAP